MCDYCTRLALFSVYQTSYYTRINLTMIFSSTEPSFDFENRNTLNSIHAILSITGPYLSLNSRPISLPPVFLVDLHRENTSPLLRSSEWPNK